MATSSYPRSVGDGAQVGHRELASAAHVDPAQERHHHRHLRSLAPADEKADGAHNLDAMLRNTVKTTILLAGLGGLMVAIGSVFGRGGAIIGLALGLLLVGFSYWKSDSLAIRAARAVPADEAQHPQYFATVRELAAKADMPMPKLYISQEQQPNAFATGRNPDHAAVAVTQGLLAACTWDEIRGVLAHELMHVRNRDILIGSVAAAVATGISFIANMAMWGAMLGGEAATMTTAARSRSWPPPSWRPSPPGCSRWPCHAAASSKPTAPAPS